MQNQKLRLAEIEIANLRSIQRETFPLGEFTPLIGYNNAGKTNILMGIHWLLSKISLDVSFFDDVSLPVEATGVFAGVTEMALSKLSEERAEAIRRYLFPDGSFRVKKIQRIPGESLDSIRQFVFDPSRLGDSAWVSMPHLFREAFERLFPEPIRIQDFGSSKTNIRLLREIFKPLEKRLKDEFWDLPERFEKVFSADEETSAEELRTFDRDVNSMLSPLFPNVKIKLEIQMPSIATLLQTASLEVTDEDDGFSRPVDEIGAGSQRAIQMALVRYLADLKKSRTEYLNCRLLLIDSPELFLHPQAVELVRVSLKKLSQEGYQIVFATHSAQMVTSEDVSTSLLIRKNKMRGTFMRKRMEDAVRQVVRDAPSQLQTLFSLSNSNELLFSDYVLLTEGKTEWRVLPTLFERMTGKSFALLKCALVRQGGVSNTRKSMMVLRAMDIPVRAIVDLDYAFTSAVHDKFLDEDDPDLRECMRIFQDISKYTHIRLVHGIPVNKRAGIPAARAYAMMAEREEAKRPIRSLHLKLRKHGIWIWRYGAIEEHLGLEAKNERAWNNFVARIKNKEPKQVIPHYEDIIALCDWIIEGAKEEK